MTYPLNSSPGAAADAWTTPERPGTMPVGYIPPAQAVVGISPVAFPGDADAGGRDDVDATVAGAAANAQARYLEHESDTHGAGSQIGDLMDLPPVVSDWSKHTAGTDATSYDPAG